MVSILIEKLLGISCFGKCISHPDKNFVATLVWKRIRNPKLTPIMNDRNDNGELDHVKNYIFELDIARCIYHCLRGKTYVDNSAEYIFYYGYGAIGTVWESKDNKLIDVQSTSIREFLRKDLARVCGIKTVAIHYIDNNTICEVALSDKIKKHFHSDISAGIQQITI